MIVPIPIFIYREKKSEKELLEEMERDRRFRSAVEMEELARKRREREEKE